MRGEAADVDDHELRLVPQRQWSVRSVQSAVRARLFNLVRRPLWGYTTHPSSLVWLTATPVVNQIVCPPVLLGGELLRNRPLRERARTGVIGQPVSTVESQRLFSACVCDALGHNRIQSKPATASKTIADAETAEGIAANAYPI